MPSSHLVLCHHLLLLPPIPPSIRVFSNESTLCMRLPKYWGFSFSVSLSNEHPGLISFRMDWLDLLAVQGCVHLCTGLCTLELSYRAKTTQWAPRDTCRGSRREWSPLLPPKKAKLPNYVHEKSNRHSRQPHLSD